MKAYAADFNNILRDLKSMVNLEPDPRKADVIILWQDVRGAYSEIARINSLYDKKPVIVVQHGRGAMRDYNEPNNFPMHADKVCVWGEKEISYLPDKYKDISIVTGKR